MAAFQFKSLVWIPTSEKLPQTSRDVLVAFTGHDGTLSYCILAYESDRGRWYDYDFGYWETIPTAWADIPSYDLY